MNTKKMFFLKKIIIIIIILNCKLYKLMEFYYKIIKLIKFKKKKIFLN